MFSATAIQIVCDSSIDDTNTVYISRRLLALWKLQRDDTITLFFGLTSAGVNITSIDDKESTLRCSQALLSRLKLHSDTVLRCSYYPSSKELLIGPIISIITEIHERSLPVSFGTLTSFCEEFAALSERSACFCYVTSLSLWNGEHIEGYVYEQGAWVKREMPFPNVVYNRIHSRKTEQGEAFKQWTELVQEYHIPYFNDRFLNKWEVHESLQPFSYLQPYIPKTLLFTGKSVLEEALSEHTTVFIKPAYGSQGRRIFKVTQTDEEYQLDYTTWKDDIVRSCAHTDDLFRILSPYAKQRPYIIQQGLELYTYNERPVDFRILCHKTEQGKWKISSAVARVSCENEFVSNVAMGGDILRIDEVLLPSFMPNEVRHMKKLLSELALEIAKCIGQSYDGLYGELGIDLGLDRDGNPWLIEVNSKPSKNMLPSASPTTIRPSVRSVLQYCCLAAQYPYKEGLR